MTDLVQPACDASQEGILIASLAHSTEGGKWEETARKRCPLAAATTTWSELLSLTQRALQELHEIRSTDDEKVLLLLSKTAVQDDDGSAIHSFFEVCCNVASLGFNKCTLTSPEAATIVLSAVRSCLQKETPPRWERLYIFQAMALPTTGHETDAHAAVEHKQKFAHMIEHLCQLIVKQPSCPLWRVDSLPVSRLTEENRHLAALLKSALDVKGCIRLLRAGNFPYRFFWTRLTWMERRLKRAEMLNNINLVHVQSALDPCSNACMVGSAQLWLTAVYPHIEGDATYWIREGGLSEPQLKELFSQLDV